MTKINVTPDCGNSPKKQLIKEFNIAFATGNSEFILDHISDNIIWVIHGDKIITGKEHFSEEIRRMKDYVADELIIHSIITHGSDASANGEMTMGDKTYSFCDVYRFTSTTSKIIKEMNSYVIEKKESL